MEISGSLTVTGSTSIKNNLVVDGTATFNQGFTGSISLEETNLFVSGNTTLGDAITDVTTVTSQLTMSAGALIADDTKLYFGSSNESYIEYDENNGNALIISGSGGKGIEVSGTLLIGSAPHDVMKVASQLTASNGMLVPDDMKLYFGTGKDASIEYDEDGSDTLDITMPNAGLKILGNGKVQITGSVEVEGTIVADAYQVVTMTTAVSSGSTIFGDGSGDKHEFTGSVELENTLAVNGNATLGNAVTDVLTVNSQLTASTGALIADDKKLYFGSSHEAYIEYDEDGGNALIISGSGGKGTEVSGNLHATGSWNLKGVLTITGDSSGDDPRMLVMDDSDASAQIGRTHIGYDGTNSDMAVFAHQDKATQTNFALRQRSNGQTELNAQAGQSISFKISSANKAILNSSGHLNLLDDIKLLLGTNEDASIEYDEDGRDRLIISGSTKGMELSGAVLVGIPPARSGFGGGFAVQEVDGGTGRIYLYTQGASGQESTTFPTNLQLKDDVILYLGDQGNALIEYDEDGFDQLRISGSTAGTVISGTVSIGVPDARTPGFRVADEQQNNLFFYTQGAAGQEATVFSSSLLLKDNTNLYFGEQGYALMKYDQQLRSRLIISGSTAGTEISGTVLVGVPDARTPGFKIASSDDESRIFLYTQGVSGQEATVYPTNIQLKDDVILYLGDQGNALIEYDEDGFDQLRISGSTAGTIISGTVSIGVPDARTPGFRVADEQQNNLFFYTQGTAGQEATVFSSSLLLKDNTNLYFGEQGYALMKYDQQLRSRLIISGSTAGTEISGTVLIGVPDGRDPGFKIASADDISRTFFYTQGTSGQEATVFPTDIQLKSNVKLNLGDAANASIEYDTDSGHDRLAISGSAQGTEITGNIYISDHEHAGQSALAEFDVTDGIVEIRANRGQSSRVRVTGSLLITGSANVSEYLMIQTANRTAGNGDPAFAVLEAGVGIGTNSPKTDLDINYGNRSTGAGLDDNTGGGEKVFIGSGTTTAGMLYYLHTDGAWTAADADAASSGATQLLAIAMGTNPQNHGMLIRGFFDAHSYLNNFSAGKAVYVSTTVGQMDTTAPAGSGDFVRVVGYCLEQSKVMYFNPDGSYTTV